MFKSFSLTSPTAQSPLRRSVNTSRLQKGGRPGVRNLSSGPSTHNQHRQCKRANLTNQQNWAWIHSQWCGPPVSLTPNQSLTFSVIFSPTTVGSATGTVTVASNATGSPTTIALSGSGQTGSYSVTLTWNASTSTVSGYNVYRSTTSGSGYAKINASLVGGLSYTDSTVQGGTTYYYVTTAVDSSGNQSGYSNQATAAIP